MRAVGFPHPDQDKLKSPRMPPTDSSIPPNHPHPSPVLPGGNATASTTPSTVVQAMKEPRIGVRRAKVERELLEIAKRDLATPPPDTSCVHWKSTTSADYEKDFVGVDLTEMPDEATLAAFRNPITIWTHHAHEGRTVYCTVPQPALVESQAQSPSQSPVQAAPAPGLGAGRETQGMGMAGTGGGHGVLRHGRDADHMHGATMVGEEGSGSREGHGHGHGVGPEDMGAGIRFTRHAVFSTPIREYKGEEKMM
ncbi:hypothetical protein HDU93_002829 [Gonapodya sp. JEL0774]|nr:hypothetical protein HDU93_002829 [Gonapodya sp. JEL0774]